jgi:transposase
MRHKLGIDRDQLLLPQSLDEYVPADSIARLIEAFIKRPEISQLQFTKGVVSSTGRPPYDPVMLLGLYLYGYYHRIRSSRSLERETFRNMEVIWLLHGLTPDFRTILRFRSENAVVLKQVFREFTRFCKGLDLISGEFMGIDGTKIRAVNSKKLCFTNDRLKKKLEYIETQSAAYMAMLDRNDADEEKNPPLSADEINAKLDVLRERKAKYERYREQLAETDSTQLSLTDPDSRRMDDKGRAEVCFNVQAVVDDKNKMIVSYEVTNDANDEHLLSKMALDAKEVVGLETCEVTADKGYGAGVEIERCLENGITPYVALPDPKTGARGGVPDAAHGKSCFRYVVERDVYECPGGNELTFVRESVEKNSRYPELGEKRTREYRCNSCSECPERSLCTTSPRGRTITRFSHDSVLEEQRKRNALNPGKLKKRGELCEHPFGTIKRGMQQSYFLTRGLVKTAGEAALSFTVYNLKRAVKILGIEKLLEALKCSQVSHGLISVSSPCAPVLGA